MWNIKSGNCKSNLDLKLPFKLVLFEDILKVDDRNITNFILTLVDDNGSYINFNNSDSYITFQIDIEYIETINRNLTFSNLINNSN